LYFGTVLEPDSLVAGPGAKLGMIDFGAWFKQSEFAKAGAAA
jgi:hypothetical protein